MLDSCRLESWNGIRPYSKEQSIWIQETLESLYIDSEIKWRIAMFHHAVYSADADRAGNFVIKATALPIMEQMDVDLIFTGHHHIYSRTHPIINDTPFIKPDISTYFDPPGIIHVTTGGGGRGLGRTQDDPKIAKHESIYHFMHIKLTNNKITVTAIDKLGNKIDYFEIRK